MMHTLAQHRFVSHDRGNIVMREDVAGCETSFSLLVGIFLPPAAKNSTLAGVSSVLGSFQGIKNPRDIPHIRTKLFFQKLVHWSCHSAQLS